MADQIEINIHLVDGATGEAGGESVVDKTEKKEKEKVFDAKKLGKYISSQTVEVFLNKSKSLISQNIGLITGKTELQQRVNFALETTQQGVNAYKNAHAGAVLFSSMGLSSGLGSALGIALSVAGLIMDIGFKQAQLNIQENIENSQIAQIRTRAGAGFNRSRRGV